MSSVFPPVVSVDLGDLFDINSVVGCDSFSISSSASKISNSQGDNCAKLGRSKSRLLSRLFRWLFGRLLSWLFCWLLRSRAQRNVRREHTKQ